MNQQPSAAQPATPDGHQPASASSPSDPDTYLIAVPAADRDHLMAALRLAAQATDQDLGCTACADLACALAQHQPRLDQIRAWRTLAHGIGRLPGVTTQEPMIRFDPHACRTWLESGAAQRAGIDDGFNSADLTIASGLEELLYLLNNEATEHVWRTVTHLDAVGIWRTADSDGIDGGAILTADLTYLGTLVRLASLHQGGDEFTAAPTICGIDAAVQSLAHVAATLNREYANLRSATGHPPTHTDSNASRKTGSGGDNVYTVVGAWVDDQPAPVGVIAGEHEVSGGADEYFPQGVWATSVIADNDHDAQRHAIAQMRAENA